MDQSGGLSVIFIFPTDLATLDLIALALKLFILAILNAYEDTLHKSNSDSLNTAARASLFPRSFVDRLSPRDTTFHGFLAPFWRGDDFRAEPF